MKNTFWTAPNAGATLQELHDEFPEYYTHILALIAEFGNEAKGGLGLREGTHRQVDYDRIKSDVFRSHLQTNQLLNR